MWSSSDAAVDGPGTEGRFGAALDEHGTVQGEEG